MKKYEVFLMLGFISVAIAIVFGSFLGYTISQEESNMWYETLFGIGTVIFQCLAIVMFITSYRIKEEF